MHSRCHIKEPTWAILDQEKSELEIICSKCEKSITKFKVADLDLYYEVQNYKKEMLL
jgi:hypothetical protein